MGVVIGTTGPLRRAFACSKNFVDISVSLEFVVSEQFLRLDLVGELSEVPQANRE
jgi:hypothetical protein